MAPPGDDGLDCSAARKDVNPFTGGDFGPLGSDDKETVCQSQGYDIARALPGQLRDARFPAFPFDPRGEEMGNWPFFVDWGRKLGTEDR